MSTEKITSLLLRIGVAFAFLYPAVKAIFDPLSWLSYFPDFMLGILPDIVLLHSFGVLEAVIAIWILSGKNIFIPSVLAALILAAIIVIHSSGMDVVFRDVPILLMAVALALEARLENRITNI